MITNLLIFVNFPELILTLGVLTILLISVFIKNSAFKKVSVLSIVLLSIVFFVTLNSGNISLFSFNYFFINSDFIIFFKLLVVLGSIFIIIISYNYFIDLKVSRFEIPILIIFSTLGMMILISSNNLMTMYLGIELQSLSLYVLASIQRNNIKSAESGIKYFILGALSSGILLYGCSLIYGFTGSANFDEIRISLNQIQSLNIGIIFGLIFILVGLAFKISAVPFHMWTPDVYEGSPTGVTAYFATVPKIAGIAIIYRFCLEVFSNHQFQWQQIIIFLSLASMYLGAISAIVQSNIKRLLAYSSIGHIGYILIGLAAANEEGIKAVIIYLIIYVVMNLGLFAILLSTKVNDNYIEKINDFSGLSKKKPLISLSLAILMFSMAGIPPFAGFFAKFYIFISALKSNLIYLAILGVIASVISAYYYLRIVKVMYFDEIKDKQISLKFSLPSLIILLVSIFIICIYIFAPSVFANFAQNVSIAYFD